jgi:hypothetical protein
MGEHSISQADVAGRARVDALAPSDAKAALQIARAIKHPWYRCQALTKVAEHLRGKERQDLLLVALKAAREQPEPNRVVTVSAWPIRALVDSSPTKAEERLEEMLDLAEHEPHNLRRAHALQSLAFSLSKSPRLLAKVIPALSTALLGGGGPRIDRCIRDTFELVRSTNPELLRALALHHKPNRQQQLLLASIDSEPGVVA